MTDETPPPGWILTRNTMLAVLGLAVLGGGAWGVHSFVEWVDTLDPWDRFSYGLMAAGGSVLSIALLVRMLRSR